MNNLSEYKNIWVYIETEEGKAKNVSYELLVPGKQLAEQQNEKLVAVIIGQGINDVVENVQAYGADEIIVVENEAYNRYNTETFSYTMEHLINTYRPSTILIGATKNGRDMGPRIACRIGTGLTADCTALGVD